MGEQVVADANYLIGDSQDGTIRLYDAYPQWSVRFWVSQGNYLCKIHIDAATGDLLKYER